MATPTYVAGEVWTAAYANSIGMHLVKTQTIGSAVSSVEVTSAFSADYDNYKIIVSGGAGSASSDLRLTLGASATAYYYGGILRTYAAVTAPFEGSNVAYWVAGIGSAQTLTMNVDLLDPYNANETSYMTFLAYTYTTGGGAFVAGYHNAATSYTSFKITPSTGTLTGGTIRVYGYRNSLT